MSPSGTRASGSRAATTSMSAGSWARSFRGLSALSGFSAMPPAPTLFLRPAPDDGRAAGGQLALQMLVAPIPMVDAVQHRLALGGAPRQHQGARSPDNGRHAPGAYNLRPAA